MTNSGTPKLETSEHVLNWAIHHQAVIEQKWHHQEGWNEKQEAWMLNHEQRLQKTENRGGKVVAVAMVLGGLVCALIPFIIDAIRGS